MNGDLADQNSIDNAVSTTQPDEFYNLGAMSFVPESWRSPMMTADITGLGALRCLEAIRKHAPECKFYQAGSSEQYGKVRDVPQTEKTPFHPRSPYGCAKVMGYNLVRHYRHAYKLHACNGILFNHESERRGHNFVTRKITMGLGKILRGETDRLVMGNIDSERDWGHAKDYVYGMWLMLQQEKPDDFVLATCEKHSVREFIEKAFYLKGFEIEWKGEGVNEIGYDKHSGKEYIFIDSKYYRPAEVELLIGDSTKAKTMLGWKPQITFEKLVHKMVVHDC